MDTNPEKQVVPEEELEEYQGLVKFVSTYRDEKDITAEREDQDETAKKVPWYKFWVKAATTGEGFVVPDSWLTTNMKTGLTAHEVELRRKKVGYN
ncbi:hypothetical protein AAULH_14306, partial [Lactobacillus helveticus MTCC 5463]